MKRIIVVSIYENDLSRTGQGSLSSTAKCKSTATLSINCEAKQLTQARIMKTLIMERPARMQ